MKTTIPLLCSTLLASMLLAAPALAAPTPTSPGHVDFGEFTAPADGTFVEVNIHGNLINMAARLTESSEPEVATILRELKSVRVNVIGMDDDNREAIKGRMASVRKRLGEKGWERIVTVQDGKEDVGVFMKFKGEEAVEGIVVTVIQGDSEAVFVNIVGNLRPEQIAEVGKRLNIEPLKKISGKLNGH